MNANFVTVVANGAVQVLIERNIKPNIVVTDLDGNPSFLQKAEKIGATLVVHAHGDNINELKKHSTKIQTSYWINTGNAC